MVQIFDTTDEDYIDRLNAHNDDVIWKVTVFALDLAFKRTDGSPLETFEEKKAVLQSNGIAWNHVNQIFNDVQDLTRLQEEWEDFLSGS